MSRLIVEKDLRANTKSVTPKKKRERTENTFERETYNIA